MKTYIFILFLTAIILCLPAQEAEEKPKTLFCNPIVPTETEVNTPVRFYASESGTSTAGEVVRVDNIVGNMRFVPATGPGGFLQGSPPSEPCRTDEETQFTHILTRNIAVMETEVTIGMWKALKAVQPGIGSDPTNTQYSYGGGDERNPVQSVTWCKLCIFANFLSIQNGLVPCYYTDSTKNVVIGKDTSSCTPIYCDFSANGYRLPTEGEWEHFTRAGTTTVFFIDEPNYNSTNCYDGASGAHPQLEKVARYWASTTYYAGDSRLGNPWNLKDVLGNVAEWCWDWYGEYPSGTVTDFQGADSGTYRVVRGGGFDKWAASDLRSARRYNPWKISMYYTIGFRLVRTL